MIFDLGSDDKKFLLKTARETIEASLDKRDYRPQKRDNDLFYKKAGVFVTLHKHGSLRGCIGYPLPVKPLLESVCDNALAAAFQDPRFNALSRDELKDTEIEISVLTLPEEIDNTEEIIIGKHGLIISSGFNRGLLLPQVPVEQKWDREEFLSYACMKAGLGMDEWKDRDNIKIEVFSAIVFNEKEVGT